jgi:hypothetical protein
MEALAAGKQVLSRSEHGEAVAIAGAVRNHARASLYLKTGGPEVTLSWQLGTFDCKGRADWIGEVVADVKSTRDASPKAFAWSCYKYGYFGQAAWYSDGHFLATGVRKPFVFIAVEKTPPYVVQVYRVPEHVLLAGREQYLGLLGRLDYCVKNNFWGGYSEAEELDLELPQGMENTHG